jgi:hypothetical protein
MKHRDKAGSPAGESREQRLAEALRANLRRRKQTPASRPTGDSPVEKSLESEQVDDEAGDKTRS